MVKRLGTQADRTKKNEIIDKRAGDKNDKAYRAYDTMSERTTNNKLHNGANEKYSKAAEALGSAIHQRAASKARHENDKAGAGGAGNGRTKPYVDSKGRNYKDGRAIPQK